jgi:hypothetical protein
MKLGKGILQVIGMFMLMPNVQGQIWLTGSNYTQNFDALGGGVPAGWSVRTNAGASSLGVVVPFVAVAKGWGDSTGDFGNFASLTNNSGVLATGSDSAAQSAFTNRVLGIRQGSSFGDPGAAFVLQITNTLGVSNLVFSADLFLLRSNNASTTWSLEYALGNSPASFSPLGTFPDPGPVGVTHVSYPLGMSANNQSQNLWLRIAALSASTGGGTRDSFGVDNVQIGFTPSNLPKVNQDPKSQTNAVGSTASFTAVALGGLPLHYRWRKGATPLSDGGGISGATTDTLMVSNVFHDDAGSYSLIVSNSFGSVTSAPATLVVVGFIIESVPPTNTLAGQGVSVALNFIDNQTPVNSASGTSGNTTILPHANILASAAGNSGSATLTPMAGSGGVVMTTLSASDGSFSTNTIFPLLVVPSTNVIFNDYFDYTNDSVISASKGIWRHESGTTGDMVVSGGELQVSRSLSELCSVALMGRPYLTSGSEVLYSRFKVRFTTLPTATGNYFAFFQDEGGNGRRARIWASTANAAAGKLRLGIGNGSDSTATTGQVARDLDTNVTYTVVTRLVVATAESSIWIDPAGETGTNSTTFAMGTDVFSTSAEVASYAFRQAGSMGIMQVDDLVVGRSFAAVTGVTTPTAGPLSISMAAGKAVLTWVDPSGQFKLATGTNITGITNVVATTSPYTNSISGQRYFRLKYP